MARFPCDHRDDSITAMVGDHGNQSNLKPAVLSVKKNNNKNIILTLHECYAAHTVSVFFVLGVCVVDYWSVKLGLLVVKLDYRFLCSSFNINLITIEIFFNFWK